MSVVSAFPALTILKILWCRWRTVSRWSQSRRAMASFRCIGVSEKRGTVGVKRKPTLQVKPCPTPTILKI